MIKELDRQQSVLDKIRTELRHDLDKMNASQRLDLNLEKGCVGSLLGRCVELGGGVHAGGGRCA